jgi:formylglycine-generating enzyme required for sulfatase activity
MGSPTDEPERYNDEVQHEVMLSSGFWLADTACTQALWQAVTGAKPSYFKGDARNPVENVSWDDVQAFLSQLNRRVSGLQARLPSEAEWEYACRAGTTTPFSFGDKHHPRAGQLQRQLSLRRRRKRPVSGEDGGGRLAAR